jgi:hypothetical protein
MQMCEKSVRKLQKKFTSGSYTQFTEQVLSSYTWKETPLLMGGNWDREGNLLL